MKPLRHTVSLGAGETPASFASRLATLHGLPAREFCLDMGTTFQKVVDGAPEALAVIAYKGSADAVALTENAFVKTAERRYTHRGQELTRDNLRRGAVLVCPKCLAEDIAAAPQSRPQIAAAQRARWQIAALKTCATHLAPLVIADKDMTPGTMHDWSHHVGKVLPDLPRLVAEAGTRPLTGFDTYVLNRLSGGSVRCDLLDTLPLHVVIAACDLFGAVALFGRTPNLNKLVDEEWRAAGGAGFDIFAGGKPSVAGFLEDLRRSYPYGGAATEGPQAVLGRIYQVLEFGRADPAYDPLRDLVGDFIRTRFPVGPGDTVFGKPVERRTLHSVRTLSVENRMHRQRLRRLLRASGVLPADADELADGYCLFDVERGSAAAREAAIANLSVRAAGLHLNVPRIQLYLLYGAGLLVPRISGTGHGAKDRFAPEDLDAFLDRLLLGAKPVKAPRDGQVNIPDAVKFASCSSEEVVRLVLDGKLTRKWRLTSERGYMSLLLDIKEVRALVRGPELDGLTVFKISERLPTTTKVAAALIEHGYLTTVTAINPVNRCPIKVAPAADVERFAAEYVSLFALAKQQGRHHMVIKKELDAAGIKPALDAEKLKASFYRRSEVSDVSDRDG
ncbi:TniQ family protein [Bradyrhizobium canariense]|uniref:TniQ family protein n=1 Tax=Bradyrhizobium canariense TaxID=255045 RepID=UPI001958712E|nr:TniQ family protein [Bradyrhizobium canariense]MBM7482336.1 hypothetical protein [Bradyrhizobium canariense]